MGKNTKEYYSQNSNEEESVDEHLLSDIPKIQSPIKNMNSQNFLRPDTRTNEKRSDAGNQNQKGRQATFQDQYHNMETNRRSVGVGRRKIEIEYLRKRDKRTVTFSKRKKGIMKKAYELSILTGSEVLLIIGNEVGQVFTFATPKLRPILNKEEDFIRACLHNISNDNYQQTGNMHVQNQVEGENTLSYTEYRELMKNRKPTETFYDESDIDEGEVFN